MSELKPCKCGEFFNLRFDVLDSFPGWYAVYCPTCSARAGAQTHEAAIAAWNRRAGEVGE